MAERHAKDGPAAVAGLHQPGQGPAWEGRTGGIFDPTGSMFAEYDMKVLLGPSGWSPQAQEHRMTNKD